MSKALKEAPLTTRAARSRLPSGCHWRAIDPGVHLGYRKGERGGRWLVRWRSGAGYQQATLARADDAFDADGSEILSFHQAALAAKAYVAAARQEAKARAAGPVLTVATAIADYIDMREARERAARGGRGMRRDARSKLTLYVLSQPLAAKPLYKVSDRDLSNWRDDMAGKLSPGSLRRTVNDLKASLNLAARKYRSRLPVELPGHVRVGLSVTEAQPGEARKQILSDADVRRIIACAWTIDAKGDHSGDLARMLLVLAATGARFGQVAAITVADVQATEGRIMVPVSRKGRGVKTRSHIGVRVGDDVIAALKPAMAGRKGGDILLERWRHKQIATAQWRRNSRGPWRSASELTRFWHEITEAAELPKTLVPYCFRHSSIVRALRVGLPIRLVASLHDTSSEMIERHYSAFVVDALDELSARATIPLTTAPATVIALGKRG